ncbi:hypothetical protein [Pseudanabaena sp. 'Roaring Creek']|uniref:hypothetical protein n=1 Tax=Pseudanabaena sp. 'Roaring Creek' TaxID=1681830 RepID=UPI0006D7B515|nr:hypothetical protein [Pseudanabaena sp. 'Roaring Creek']
MQIYWSTEQVPELANLKPEQSKQAWQFCYKKYAYKHWQVWASLSLLGILAALGSKYFGIIGAAIGGGIGGGIFGVVSVNVLRPHLRDYVSSHFADSNHSNESNSED